MQALAAGIPATPGHPAAACERKVSNGLLDQLFRKGLYIGRGSV
jgi:hypothetical protein